MDIFTLLYPTLKLKPPIKLFEAFSGIGTQAMALKRIANYELVGFSEIDKYAIQSYEAIHGNVKNYGDITLMKTIPQCDIFTWSFPCTDLSKAGQRKGMTKETRSGLVYDVLRLVKDTQDKPQVLIMENVPDLVQTNFVRQFNEIQLELETYGYTNYVERLNSKDYGVAQNRDRVFMVSLLGEYNYDFPTPIKLEKRLKDYLEDKVDKKYYLSDNLIVNISYHNEIKEVGYLKRPSNKKHQSNTVYNTNGIARGLCHGDYKSPLTIMKSGLFIPENTKKGFTTAQDGDGVYTNRPHQKRGVVQKGMIQTIKANNDDIGVVVGGAQRGRNDKQTIESNRCEHSNALTTVQKDSLIMFDDLRIRKLTPLECWRLMGIDDTDFYKAQAKCSNSQLYKQAGNAIVVDVFEAILNKLIKEEPK